MFFLAVDFDPFATGADEVLQRSVQVQRVTHLVKISHLQICALPDLARRVGHVWLQLTQNQLEQSRFPRAVGPQQADLVTAQQSAGEAVDDDLLGARVAKALGHIGEFGHDLAAFFSA